MANKKIQQNAEGTVPTTPETEVPANNITMSQAALDEILYEMKSLKKQVENVEKKTAVVPSAKEKYI
jgi:hypothetical protein